MSHNYEVILPGFDGATDKTDDRVIWVRAESPAAVAAIFPQQQWIELLGMDAHCADGEIAGMDFEIKDGRLYVLESTKL